MRDWALPRAVLGTAGSWHRGDTETPGLCPRSGAGQVLTDTEGAAAGKGPCPSRQGVGTACSGPSPALGTSRPTGLQEGAFQHLSRCPLAGQQPHGGTRWAKGAGDSPSTKHPQAPAHGTGTTRWFIYLGIGSLFKAFFVAHFLLRASPRLTRIFWGRKDAFLGGEESCISALRSLRMPFVIHISDPGGCCHPPFPQARLRCPWGKVLWDSSFTFQRLNPVCSTLNLSLASASFVSREPQPMSPGTGVVGGPVSRRAPGRAWLCAGTKASSSLETPIHHWQTRPAKVNI